MLVQNKAKLGSRTVSQWKNVVRAVEQASPVYDWISEVISLGLAGPLRQRAISQLGGRHDDWILDSGSGPGVATRLLSQNGFRKIVAVDPSIPLLRYARSKLPDSFHPVCAVAESLPFRDGIFSGIVSCFSLRDVRSTRESLRQFKHVMKLGGRLEIVDVGKPDDSFLRYLSGIYISYVMPVIAKCLIRGRIKGNPFRWIVPTLHQLLPNHELWRLVRNIFGVSVLQEFLFGGLIIIEGRTRGLLGQDRVRSH